MAGASITCPTCHGPFVLPRSSVKASAKSPSPRRKQGGSLGKMLPLLVLLAGGCSLACYYFQGSPDQLWKRLLTLNEPPAESVKTPVPQVPPPIRETKGVEQLSPSPELLRPVEEAAPQVAVIEEEKNLALVPELVTWMLANPQGRPKQILLRETATFETGQIGGSQLKVPAGTKVSLMELKENAVVVAYQRADLRAHLPITATDLLDSGAQAREAYLNDLKFKQRLIAIKGTSGGGRAKFVHPGVTFTREDLNALKDNITREPWRTGYEKLSSDRHSQLDYKMQGPCANVQRAPDVNLGQWRNDMNAVYNLALMWWFTGKSAYAQKSRDILIAWAKTQKSFGGGEAGLDLGDYVWNYAVGADILRGTWPGWTRADTDLVKKLFLDVYYPATGVPHNTIGPANKGTLVMAAGAGIAAFCDDQEKLDHIADLVRTSASSGLLNTLPTGEIGETGRDGGHAYGQWANLAFTCEVLWKQGIDVYSELEDRMLATGEYYARNDLGLNSPFVYFGTIDYHYVKPNPYLGWSPPRRGLALLHGAYAVRKGIVSPFLERLRQALPIDDVNWVYEKTVDRSTAAPLPPVRFPTVARVSSGLEDTDIGGAAPTGGSSYDKGVWTITGGGSDIWTDGNDSCHFTYKKLTGDCAIIAKVVSVQNTAPNAKAGIMIRGNLSPTAGQRAWMGVRPDHKMEFYQRGWSPGGVWGGSNWDKGNREVPNNESYWLKMERMGDIVSLYLSVDGASWAAVSAAEYAGLPSTVYIGLTVCSAANGTPCSATFSNVSVSGGDGAQPLAAPAAPLNVFASPGPGRVPLRWLSAHDATRYKIKRSTTSGGPYETITTVSGNSYTDTDVTNGTTYYYVVSALNAVGESPDSPEDATRPRGWMWNIACDGAATAYARPNNAGLAFDCNSETKWYAGENAGVGAIQYDFGAGRSPLIGGYAVTSANDVPERDPRDWQFQGSNDGSIWTTLDTQSGQSFPFRHYEMGYSVSKPGAYRYYRLNFTADNGAHSIQIGDIALLSDEVPPNSKISPLPHWGTNDDADREQAFKSKNAYGN